MKFMLIILSLLIGSISFAADVLTIKTTSKGKADETSIITIQNPFIKITTGKRDIIFDDEKKSIVTINHEKSKYTLIKKEQFEQMSNTANTMFAALKEKMKNLPPKQKEMMMKMMSKNVPNFKQIMNPGPKIKYRMIKKKVSCKDWNCKKYEAFKGKTKHSDLLVASAKELGMSKDSFKIIESMNTYFTKLAGNMGVKNTQIFAIEELGGLPIKTSFYKGKEVYQTASVVTIKKEKIAKSKFTAPENYKKNEINMPPAMTQPPGQIPSPAGFPNNMPPVGN